MKRNKPVIIIVVGILCAILAVIVVQRQISRSTPAVQIEPGVPVLVATRAIVYGEPLVVSGKGDKANVVFVPDWPQRLKPDGAITDQKRLAGAKMLAKVPFVRHEPILESEIMPESDLVPPDMEEQQVTVDPDAVKSGRLVAGQRVDVLRIVGTTPSDFMRSVRLNRVVVAEQGGRGRDPVSVMLLIKKQDRLPFLKAKYSSGTLLVVPAADPSLEGPLLVDLSGTEEAEKAEIRQLLDQGKEQMKSGDYEKALSTLEDARTKYPELRDLCNEASRQEADCRRQYAAKLYDQAQQAVERDKDFTTAQRLLDRIEGDFADIDEVVKKAKALRGTFDKALAEHRKQLQYAALLKDLPAALEIGDLPRAGQLVSDLRKLSEEGLKPDTGSVLPAAALAEYDKKLQDAEGKYAVDKQVLESFLKAGNYDQAREKLRQMKERFPGHPDIQGLGKQIPSDKTVGAQVPR